MNNKQLHWILSNDKVTSRNFKGIYVLDEIKHIQQISFPSAYFFNLDPSYKPGVHWIAVYIGRKGRPEYFDSFGRPPPREIKDFLCTYVESWNYNDVPVQELYSTTCGQFVVFYIYQRCSGLTLKSILRKYFNPHAKIMNNVLVRDFVKMHYQFSAKVTDPNFIRRVAKEIEFNPIQAGGAHCAPPPHYRLFPCCAETASRTLMKLSDF